MEREMNKIVKVAVIIPCYNEQDNVLAMFSEIKNALKLSKKKGTNKRTDVLVGLSKAIKPRLANVRKTNLLDLAWINLVII